MKYAFYPGCVSKGDAPEPLSLAVRVATKLGIELEEMRDVACTGAGVLPQYISDPINARTFAKAERMGLPIMTICSTCQGVFGQANLRLQDPSTGPKSTASTWPRKASNTGHYRHQASAVGRDGGLRRRQAQGDGCAAA